MQSIVVLASKKTPTLQSGTAVVSFIVGSGKSVVNYTSGEKQRLLKEQCAWRTSSASSQLVFSHEPLKFPIYSVHIKHSLKSLYQVQVLF